MGFKKCFEPIIFIQQLTTAKLKYFKYPYWQQSLLRWQQADEQPTMIEFQIEKLENFSADPIVVGRLQEIIETSYREFDILKGYMLKDLHDCDEIYVAKNELNEIVAFFWLAYYQLDKTSIIIWD